MAQGNFISEGGDRLLLDEVFGRGVRVNNVDVVDVGACVVDGVNYAAVTINLRNVVDQEGFPISYKPSAESLNAFTHRLCLLEARKWVRWFYLEGEADAPSKR